MKVKTCNSESEIIEFVLANYGEERYGEKMFTSPQELEEMLYFEFYNGTLEENILNFRNKPKSFPVNVLLTEATEFSCNPLNTLTYLAVEE